MVDCIGLMKCFNKKINDVSLTINNRDIVYDLKSSPGH
jgi:hypothetical protein